MIATQPAAEGALPSPILEVTREAVEATMLSILGERPDHQPTDGQPAACSGIVGIISFLGDLSWSYSLILPEQTASTLIQKFVGFEIPYASADMADAVGELANVLAGDIVARLETKRIKAQMSLPTVARGTDVEMISPAGLPSARIFFSAPIGRFWLKVSSARKGTSVGRQPGS